jgi:preprotein translocase subunit SecD
MRRFLPFIIIAVGLAAFAVDLPLRIARPFAPDGQLLETKLGLDLQGGLRGEYQAIPQTDRPVTPDILATIRTIIENRVNATGLAEPIVQTQGADRINVEIPGTSDRDQVRALVGNTGKLEFIPLPPEEYGTQTTPGTKTAVAGLPLEPKPEVLFTGEEIAAARPAFDTTQGNRLAVGFDLKPEGSRKFAQYTSQHIDEFFAIVLDDLVVSAPFIQGAITTGTGQISGDFTVEEQNRLVTTLRFGALPLQLREVSFTEISATLGQDFLRQSILAGIIGIGLVFLFMLVHYRLPGLVACVALLYYALVVYAIFRLLPVTLTLAGVAGFVLSVGMAVDANILIFERTKEELRSGKTINAAIEAGFNRAWNSILDSNVSSLITASILVYFGSATIKGFALVLIIGVLVSMFTAITLSRVMLRWVVRQPWARKAQFYGVEEGEFTLVAPRGRSREAGVRA